MKNKDILAFPGVVDNRYMVNQGMTLRDYFAGKVLNGFCSNSECMDILFQKGIEISPGLAKHSYEIADAMLAERIKS